MRRAKAVSLLILILSCLSPSMAINAQVEMTSLRPGESIERTIARRNTHSFNVSLEKGHLLQLVVEQHGVDLVVRVYSPDGASRGQFDSPNGTDGPENVSLVANTAGVYRIDVLPLEVEGNAASGRYDIKILDLRHATKEELESIKNREAAKAKGAALLAEVAASLQLIRLPETRIRLQMQAAQLLWDTDEKLARKLIDEAIDGVKDYLANVDTGDQNYYQGYQNAMQLRNEVLTPLIQRNPELALSFLLSTRVLVDPNAGQGGGQQNQELQWELSIATQIATKDSKRALQVAERSLKKGYSYNLIETLSTLRMTDHESAAKLAGEIARKLQNENLLANQDAAHMAVNLLGIAGSPTTNEQTPADGEASLKATAALLSDQEYRGLFDKALSAGLSYSPSAANHSSNERNSAQNLLNFLKSVPAEMEKYAPGRFAAVEKRANELNTPADPQSRLWQKYQDSINNGSLDAALEAIGQAPQELRGQLYEQAAQKASGAGDFARARQILTDHISNPFQRQQALRNLEQQVSYYALNHGKLEEALRSVGNLPTAKERARMLIHIANQMGETQKREAILDLLEQARRMIVASGRAEDQEQMDLLFEVARAYSRFEPKRGFEILEPIVDQFNEMSEAAVPLNGFGQQFFRDGELLLQNGNILGNIASQLASTLGTLAVSDFDRAKTIADGMKRMEARLVAYLAIAQSTINQDPHERVDFVIRARG